MARIQAHILAYTISGILERRLKQARVPKPKTVAEEIAPLVMDEIPMEAFEPRDVSEDGYLFFHGDVDEDRCRAMQEAILETHLNIDKKKPITLFLSTYGGEVFAGLALCATIQEVRRSGRKVNVHIQGCAMSMGSLIAQACDHRSIEPLAWMMIHELSDRLGLAKTAFLKDDVEFHERLEIQVFSMYALRTGKPVPYWRKKMHRKDVFMTAEEALADGLVDEIRATPPFRRQRHRKAISSMPADAQSSSTRGSGR